MSRCPRCTGALIRDLDGACCLNCGPLRPLVSVNVSNDESCEGCGTVLGPRERVSGEPRRFCNVNCRVRTWTRKKRAKQAAAA